MKKLRLKNMLSKLLQINKSVKDKARFLRSLWAIPFYSTAPPKDGLEKTTSASHQKLLEIKISNPSRLTELDSLIVGPRKSVINQLSRRC